jgi:hypothetical protein
MVSIKDALLELGKNKKYYENLEKDGYDARREKDPLKNAAYGLYLTSLTSEDPQRFLSTLSPFYESKINFKPYYGSGTLGEVPAYIPEATVYTTDNRGTALHELVHTLQMKEAKSIAEGKKEINYPMMRIAKNIRNRALALDKEGKIEFPSTNWKHFYDELDANVYDVSRRYEEAGKDYTQSEQFKMLFPDEESQLYYYTQILPGTNVAYPGTSTFKPTKTIDKSKSYARQAIQYVEDLLSNPLMEDTTK